jgi:hypothetical protein
VNCREWEERIAGDPEDAAVVGHVAECPGCQVFASGLRQTLAELRMAHDEEIAPAHYSAVRARVLAELRPGRRWGWSWAAAVGVAAACAGVVAVGLWMRVAELPAVAIRVPGVVEVARPLPDGRGSVGGQVARWTGRGKRGRVAAAKGIGKREEIVMKIETEDRDVVIYWIAETKGDE